MARIVDRERAEGVYVSSSIYVGAAELFKIERVNGDCTVDDLEITRDEAKELVKLLELELATAPLGRYDTK
jgi:hypothetical protein